MEKILLVIQTSLVYAGWKERLFQTFNNGKTVLEYLIYRLKNAGIFEIVLATSENQKDDSIAAVAKEEEVACIRGSLDNVISRLCKVLDSYNCSDFLRISSYNALVDIDCLCDMYRKHVSGVYDYSFNEHAKGLPLGMGGDAFSASVIRRLNEMDLSSEQRESVGLYIRQNTSVFSVQQIDVAYPSLTRSKLAIETLKDFELVNELIYQIPDVSLKNVASYLDSHKVLAQYNRENPPREAGVEKLMLNEHKVNSILSKNIPDESYPVSVELTLTNACNLRCVYCSDWKLREKQGINNITLEEFKALFDDLASGGTKGVVLEGGGEPTIYPHFTEVVSYARSVGLAVGLITNGTRKLPPETLQNLEWIRVSFDASTREEYLDLKGVDAFELVLSNIAFYVQHCKTVGVGYVVTNKNLSQLESLVLRLRKIKASYIQLRPVVDNDDLYPKGVDLSYLKYYEKNTFGVEIGGMTENAVGGNNNLPCYAHSVTSIISGDGSVFLCGRLNIYDWLKPIGNIRKQKFFDIWNGEERKKQAEMVNDASFCEKNCPQCRISKFNAVFDRLHSVQTVHFI